MAVVGTLAALTPRVWLEAVRPGVRTAVRVGWLADGGRGFWTVFRRGLQAVGATALLAFSPAAQTLYTGATAGRDGRTRACQQWVAGLRHRLRHGHEQQGLAEVAALVEPESSPDSARETLPNGYHYTYNGSSLGFWKSRESPMLEGNRSG